MAIERRNYDPATMYGAQENITVDLGDVLDSNGNEILEFDAVASAVNYVRIANSATGSGPTISAQGDDTNIPLNLSSIGTGAVNITTGTSGAIITSSSNNGLAVGANGSTNPAFNVDTNASSAATGLQITAAAAASGVAVAAISSGTNENLTIDAKGSGTITLNATATGNIVLGRAATGVSLAVTAGLTSSGATGAGIGYATGAGGAVTQATSRTTGVTLNKLTGAITLVSAAGSATPATFTVTNTTVAATDTIVVSQKSGTDLYHLLVTAVAAGSFNITFFTTGGTTTEQPVINFAVLKAVAA